MGMRQMSLTYDSVILELGATGIWCLGRRKGIPWEYLRMLLHGRGSGGLLGSVLVPFSFLANMISRIIVKPAPTNLLNMNT